MNKIRTLTVLACLALTGAGMQAATISFQNKVLPTPAYDGALAEEIRSTGFGPSNAVLFAGSTKDAGIRSMFRFDVSNIPANAKINSVTLTLSRKLDIKPKSAFGKGVTSATLNLYPMTAPFAVESTWASVANSYNPDVVLSSLTINTENLTSPKYTLESSENFVKAVQEARAKGGVLSMMLMLPNDVESKQRSVFAFVNVVPKHFAKQPLLTVDYTEN